MAAAGRSAWLLQRTTDEQEHGTLSAAGYRGMLEALDGWVTRRTKPSDPTIDHLCAAAAIRLMSERRLIARK